jgi:hypothetical protein
LPRTLPRTISFSFFLGSKKFGGGSRIFPTACQVRQI